MTVYMEVCFRTVVGAVVNACWVGFHMVSVPPV